MRVKPVHAYTAWKDGATFCGLPIVGNWTVGHTLWGKPANVTRDPKLVTCKRCERAMA